MTSDNLEATLIDDSLFGDIFTMQSQFLDDFEFGLEANNIDTLLELFEEEEKKCDTNTNKNNNYNNLFKSNSELNQNERSDILMISLPKVRKSTTNSPDMSTKRKGTSLLAKPKKSCAKRSLININDRDFHSISSYLLQDHDYCLISEETNKLYNKLPDYITEFSTISNNCSSNESFDKIPNYIKGFLNLNDNINESEDFIANNDNILIELNEAYIEVSDVVFDNDFYSIDKNDCEVYGEDFNSESSNYSTIMSEESKDMNELNDILKDNQFLPQIEQNDSNNYNPKDIMSSNRSSRSRSREQRNPNYIKNRTQRRRRLSTRSSVDSKSDSSSSCSSCSCDSFSSRSSEESKMNFELSNSIITNESNGQPLSRKRSVKEPYCQNNFRSKVKNCNKSVINVKSGRNSNTFNTKKDIEERKIIYVGKIPDGTTKTDIRYWFGQFGAIKEVSIHFRDRGDNYAFVTFQRRADAFQAIEHANEDTRHPKFDLSFGGRRQFCKTRYEDLDFAEEETSFGSERMDFDALLRSTQAKLNR